MRSIFFVAVAVCALTSPAQAAVVDLAFRLTAINFVQFFPNQPPTPPVPIVNGDFRVVFDNSANIQATSNGLTVTSFNLPAPAFFAYDSIQDVLSIGTFPSPGGLGTGTGDAFGFFVFGASTPNIRSVLFSYSSSQVGGLFDSFNVTLSPLVINGGIPEPASWAMMIGGFGFVGATLRRRKRLTLVESTATKGSNA